jgi:hypothetical protein
LAIGFKTKQVASSPNILKQEGKKGLPLFNDVPLISMNTIVSSPFAVPRCICVRLERKITRINKTNRRFLWENIKQMSL